MELRIAERDDLETLCQYDRHIAKDELKYSILRGRVLIAEQEGVFMGWLRYNLFWDNTPFMNMLFLLEEHRGKGYGKQIVTYWERRMRQLGYSCVMTSTASDEYAQHFYVKSGYRTVGGFLYQADPYEIILMKDLPKDIRTSV